MMASHTHHSQPDANAADAPIAAAPNKTSGVDPRVSRTVHGDTPRDSSIGRKIPCPTTAATNAHANAATIAAAISPSNAVVNAGRSTP